MPVSAYALTSLANLKEYMGITSTADDTILEKCINRASARIESYCNRIFKARDIQEWRDGAPISTMRLYQWPVIKVTNVWTGSYAALVIGAGDTTDIRASVGVVPDPGSVELVRTISAGVTTATSLTYATYPTTTDLATAIGGTAGFTCALGKNMRSVQLRPRAGGDTISNPQTVTLYAADIASEYTFEGDNGFLSVDRSAFEHWDGGPGRFPMGAQSVLVEYRAGYETIPDDLEQCCIEVSAMLFRDRRRDKSLVTERLGDYSYSRAAPAGEVMGSSILAIMEEYLLEYREFA